MDPKGPSADSARARQPLLSFEVILLVALVLSFAVLWAVFLGILRVVSPIFQTKPSAVLLAVPILAVAGGPVLLERAVTPVIEQYVLWRIRRQRTPALPSLATFERVSPWSVLAPTWICGLGAFFFLDAVADLIGENGILALGFGFAYLGATYTSCYHRLPNNRRSVKYLVACLSLSVVGVVSLCGIYFTGSDKAVARFLFIVDPCIWTTVFFWVRIYLKPGQHLVPGEADTLNALRSYSSARQLGPGPGIRGLLYAVLSFVPLFGPFIWSVRICAKERMSHAPILYLRSFAHTETAHLLANAVSPALAQRSVLLSLVHPSQTAHALHRELHSFWTSDTFAVPDKLWREWFERELENALAVVVDATIFSDSTAWELNRAQQVLGHNRVAVLCALGQDQDLPLALTFEYSDGADNSDLGEVSGKPDLGALKGALSMWIDAIVEQTFVAAHPA